MELQPRGHRKVVQLIDKGATIPNPSSLHIGDEVNLSRVSAKGLTIYPGCRIYGAKTVICPGVTLGAEGPVTVEDCTLGPKVDLKGGYFKQSVLLEGASMGLGAEIREGCLLEEHSRGAHCVGLKQTILFPFVTLGSLVTFCDCFMGGGTGREDHSEVGSSYIHFNYTPDGDKATPSLFGDVPRGVMLDQPRIFLGGQGGAVGPLRVEFGTVVAAGSILRGDVTELRQLVFSPPPRAMKRSHTSFAYKNMTKLLRANVAYLANLAALDTWYRVVRHIFFARQEMGELVYLSALDNLALAMTERAQRLRAVIARAVEAGAAEQDLVGRVDEVCAVFGAGQPMPLDHDGEAFLAEMLGSASEKGGGYVEAVQSLSPPVAAQGVKWLQGIVNGLSARAAAVLWPGEPQEPPASAGA